MTMITSVMPLIPLIAVEANSTEADLEAFIDSPNSTSPIAAFLAQVAGCSLSELNTFITTPVAGKIADMFGATVGASSADLVTALSA